ncbi:SpoIIE family protein phosphatase [Streptomyces sp. NRRL S-350]|uniref:SpoIIE family protein phosphatase n=1 Tax=Streptomyces sp. NRRL S-350 TaxID=1463902 RepID=UPI000AE0CADC|nr:SpoIIE family protein phosphatase [Streptomyces sp. NRRL S-350]
MNHPVDPAADGPVPQDAAPHDTAPHDTAAEVAAPHDTAAEVAVPLGTTAEVTAPGLPAAGTHRVGRQRDGAAREQAPTRPATDQEPGAVSRLAATVERLRGELAQAHSDAAGRSLVELAVGVLVERLRCGPTEASLQLNSLAEQAGVTVLDLAADLVNQASADRISAMARTFLDTSVERADPAAVRLRTAQAHALATADTEAAAESMLEHALRPLGAVAVAIWAAHPDQSLSLRGSAGFGEAEAQRWRHVPPGVFTPARRALDERAAVVCTDLTEAAGPSIGQHQFTGGRLAVPAGIGGRLIGVLEVCWPGPLPQQSRPLQRQFEALAELAAATLETWTDHGPATRAPDTGAVDAELDSLRQMTAGVFDPCLVLHLAPDSGEMPLEFVIRHVNPAFVDFAGRPTSEVLGARLLEAYPLAAETGGLAEKIEHVFATGEPFRARRMRLAAMVDGVPLHALGQVSISRHGDHVLVIWRLEDGTSRVARLLQHAQRLGRIGGFEENLRSHHIVWNDTLFDLHGLSPTDRPIPLEHLADHAHPDDRDAIARFLRTLLHHQRPASTAFRLQRPDGVTRHIRVVAEPVPDPDSSLRIVRGAYQDISAQHWTEVALAATRDQLAQSEQQAAERSRLALQLQHAIMPPARGPLDLPDLRVAVRYRPAEKDHLVGGDWYDALTLPSGEVLLCVGDVAGHGIEAATGMVALRNALRGLAATGAGPAQLLSWLNSVTHHLTDNVTATAVCGLYEPETCRLRWARAGHLPPVLLRKGRAEPLPQIGGLLLGALDHADYEEHEVQLEADDTLVMFTDGLIERRDQSVHASLAGLLALTEKAHQPAHGDGRPDLEAYLDHLLRYSASDTDDDTCLVGVSVSGPRPAAGTTPDGV